MEGCDSRAMAFGESFKRHGDGFRNDFTAVIVSAHRKRGSAHSRGRRRNGRIGKYLIDPNALLWFSLEFVHRDARLLEQILFWLTKNSDYVSPSALLKKLYNKKDVRRIALNDLFINNKQIRKKMPFMSIHGRYAEELNNRTSLDFPFDCKTDITFYSQIINAYNNELNYYDSKHNKQSANEKIKLSPHCLLLRTTPLFGSDLKKILIIFCITNPQGLDVEQIENLTGYSKRMVSEVLNELTATGFLNKKDVSFYYINKYSLWCKLLDYDGKMKFLDSNNIFESIVILLRTISECIRKEIPFHSRIVEDAIVEAKNKITKAAFLQHEKTKPSSDVIKLIRTIFSV